MRDSVQADDLCLDVSALGGPVKLFQCHGMGGNQRWQYDVEVPPMSLLLPPCHLAWPHGTDAPLSAATADVA